MSIATYSELLTRIRSFGHATTHLDDELDSFIDLAEVEIWQDLRVKEMESRDETLTLSTSSRYLTLPTDTLEVRRIYLNVSPIHKLTYKTPDEIPNFYRQAAGRPNFYSIIGEELEFERTPDSADSVHLSVYKKLTALSMSNTSNAILTNYPNIYLYGCLAQLFRFRENSEGAEEKYLQKYLSAVRKANRDSKMQRFSGSALHMNTDFGR